MRVLYQEANRERASALDIAASHVDKDHPGIRIRVQPSIYQRITGNYLSWREVSWTVVVDDPREAEKFRATLAAFFVRLDVVGIDYLRLELDAKNSGIPLEKVIPVESVAEPVSLTDSQS